MKSAYDIVNTVLVTEKNSELQEQNKYCFKVRPDANKIEIKHAVEQLFDVKVISVNVINCKGKPKRSGRSNKIGHRADWKKAIVTLHEDSSIDVF